MRRTIAILLGTALASLTAAMSGCSSKRLPMEQPPVPGAYMVPKRNLGECITASYESLDPKSDFDWCAPVPEAEHVNSSNHFIE